MPKTLRQSALNTFELCMYKGLKEWGDVGQTGLQDEQDLTNKYATIGIIFHEVMELWGNEKIQGTSVTLPVLHNIIDEKLNDVDVSLFTDKEEIEKYRESLHEQLDWAYEKASLEFITPIGVEVSFKQDVLPGTLPVTGTIDLVTGDLDKKEVSLCDWKTGKTYTKKELESNIQATLYSLAFYKMFGFLPEQFIFYFSKTKKVKIIKITPDFIKKGTERILATWYKITEGDFVPNCTNRYFCKNFCTIYKECPKYKKSITGTSWDNIGKDNK